jgi:hypothetical protein
MAATGRERVNRWFSARRQAEHLASLFAGTAGAAPAPGALPVRAVAP